MPGSDSNQVGRPISIVGGVYRERCRLPVPSDEIWGSGGRAAAITSGLGVKTRLSTVAEPKTGRHIESIGQTFGFETDVTAADFAIEFRYDHALSSPQIWPRPEHLNKSTLNISAEAAVVFGMLEADAEVKADWIVYDPQNLFSPKPLLLPERSPSRVAYVLNGAEAARLSDQPQASTEEMARTISAKFNANPVVIKRGAWGALVLEDGKLNRVPSYRTDHVWPIGSGDVFAAAFAAMWACRGLSALEAAGVASKAAALYVNDRVLPIRPESLSAAEEFRFPPILLSEAQLSEKDYHIYLAGPFFSIAQRWLVEETRLALRGMGLKVFSPLHDVGIGHASEVAPEDIKALVASRALIALVDGLDSGTIFEIGYARCLGKPVIVFAESTPDEPLKMLTGTSCEVVSDFVTAMYKAAWAACT